MRQLGKLGGAQLALALGLTLFCAGSAFAAPARAPTAPTAEEQKAFADGLRAYETGDARGAERAWKAGYSVSHDPAFLVRIGEAQEKAGAPKEAVQTYEQYLRESPDAADHADIQGRLRRLAPSSPNRPAIEVETPGELGSSGAAGSAPSSGGAPPPAENMSAGTGGPSSPPSVPAQVRDENEDLKPIIEDEPARSSVNVAAWVGVGVTAALLGSATFFGASASERAGDANRLLLYFDKNSGVPQEYAMHAQQFEDDVRLGKRDDRLAKVFAIAAGATAIASVVLFVLDARTEKPAPRIALHKAPGRKDRGTTGGVTFGLAPTGLMGSF